MIDIEITDSIASESKVKKIKDIEKIKGVTIHCRSDLFEYKEDTVFTKSAMIIASDNEFKSEKGYHFIIDDKNIMNCVPDNKQTQHIVEGKNTFINRALYNNKANEESIAILIVIPKDSKYENIERKAIKFIADYLIKNELSPDNVMRAFDLNRSSSPLHLLEKDKWRHFIKLLEDAYKAMKDNDEIKVLGYKDEDLEKAKTSYTDKEVREFYLKYGQDADNYSKDFEPDHRDIEAIVQFKSNDPGDIKEFTTKQNNIFTYSVVENAPTSSSHCSRAFDTLTGKATPNNLEVEPIYPDLAVPPGGTITLLNSNTESKPTQSNSVPLSVEEFENREKAFNIKDYVDTVKKIEGKPVNNNDPFPTDDKIKELESHMPKVKIDEVAFNLHDCNHPDSIIGPAVASNFAMVQDEIITMAKRTERRLVKLENILSTVMRNLFRTASRMQINCVYYGGQDIYGKYKCIRCLHNDRINDGQSMTLDQCLSCTRYEPVLGQVYAILDDTGANVAQVLDDIQMSYMSMGEYIDFTRTEEMHVEREPAKLNTEAMQPKPFSEIFEEGFKMDWTPTSLEAQRHNVAEYKTEGIEAIKPEIKKENEPTIEDEFKNVVEETEPYETLKYDSNNYNFENFGAESNLTIPGLYGGGAEIRKKIVEYAENGFKLCKDGKGRYTMNTNSANGPTRYSHNDNAVNGIHYWDCSSFTEAAYKSAGITSIAGNTSSEYPLCLPSTGGIIIPNIEEDKALPGDLVWFTSQEPKPSTQDELVKASLGQIGHVGIYIGNGEYIHASTDDAPITEQIKKSPTKNWDKRIFAFGRPKELVEADKNAISTTAADSFDPDIQKLPNDLRDNIKSRAQSWANGVITNNQKWNYAHIFASVCAEKSKQYGIEIDPYMMMALSGVEASGNPHAGGPDPGLMQLAPGSGGASLSTNVKPGSAEATEYFKTQISGSIDHLMGKRKDIMALRGNEWGTWPITLYGYNSGQGTVANTIKTYSLSPITGGEFAPYIKQYVSESGIVPYPQVRYEYFARILWTYQILVQSLN